LQGLVGWSIVYDEFSVFGSLESIILEFPHPRRPVPRLDAYGRMHLADPV
jgi:hypothetical protein